MYCSKCGASVTIENKFCPICGYNLKENSLNTETISSGAEINNSSTSLSNISPVTKPKDYTAIGIGILVLVTIIGMFLIFFLGGSDSDQDIEISEHSLVGNWAWEFDVSYRYEFNADGTGVRGGGIYNIEEFEWSIPRAGRLTINITSIQGEEWNFIIENEFLTLDSRQLDDLVYSYMRLSGEEGSIIGTWIWEFDVSYRYVFDVDGTGTRGSDLVGFEEFEWLISNEGYLIINIIRHPHEDWNYTIDGEILTLVSRQFEEWEYSYIRLD